MSTNDSKKQGFCAGLFELSKIIFNTKKPKQEPKKPGKPLNFDSGNYFQIKGYVKRPNTTILDVFSYTFYGKDSGYTDELRVNNELKTLFDFKKEFNIAFLSTTFSDSIFYLEAKGQNFEFYFSPNQDVCREDLLRITNPDPIKDEDLNITIKRQEGIAKYYLNGVEVDKKQLSARTGFKVKDLKKVRKAKKLVMPENIIDLPPVWESPNEVSPSTNLDQKIKIGENYFIPEQVIDFDFIHNDDVREISSVIERGRLICDGKYYTAYINDQAVTITTFAKRLGFMPMKRNWPWNLAIDKVLSVYPIVMEDCLLGFKNYLVKVVQVTK